MKRRVFAGRLHVLMAAAATLVALAGCVPLQPIQPGQTVVVQPQPYQTQFAQPVVVQPPVVVSPAPVMVAPSGVGQLPPSIARAFPVQGAAFAQNPGRAPTLQELAAVGEAVQINNQLGGCDVDMVLNRDQFFVNIPRLQSLGLLNSQITPQYIQNQVLSVSMAFALQAATIVAHEYLSQPTSQPVCHFRQALSIPTAGGPQLLPMFEFNMDRNTDARAPWARLLTVGFSYNDANQFIAAVPSFQLSPAALQRIRQENGA